MPPQMKTAAPGIQTRCSSKVLRLNHFVCRHTYRLYFGLARGEGRR